MKLPKILHKKDEEEDTLDSYPEYHNLLKHYNEYSNTYDFTRTFLKRLNDEKGMSKKQLMALTGLTTEIEDPELQNKLYKIIIEELVIHLVKE